ncbi:MAG: SIMPL domain-containing protein [Candidatus Moranbacteria bacterium]|nr:SIMPL domain-containing protein [Candidatus Moranbacteria bacterium]
MTEEQMKQMKSVAVVVLALSAVIYVYHYGRSIDQAYPNKTFSVDGEAKMETATNIATFTASVVTEGGKNVADVQKQNVDKMNTINAFLQEKGVEKKDLQTSQYSLTPRYTYFPCDGRSICPPAVISGYTLTQTLSVKVRNLESVGDILSGIVEKGANNVSGISFTVDDDTDAKQAARTEAIAKAKLKAEQIAKAGNFRIGKLVSLYEDSGVTPDAPTGYGGLGGVAIDAKSVAPVIEPGTAIGTVHMNLTYEIIN